MRDIVELVASLLEPDDQQRFLRALIVMRDCAKKAMTTARKADQDITERLCRGAYQGSCRQIDNLEQNMALWAEARKGDD